MKPKICANPKCQKSFEPNTTFQLFCCGNCRVSTFLRAKRAAIKQQKEADNATESAS